MRHGGFLVLAGVAVAGVVALALLLRGETRAALPHEDPEQETPASRGSASLAEFVRDDRSSAAASESTPPSDGPPETKAATPPWTTWTIRGRALDTKLACVANASVEGKLFSFANQPAGGERTIGLDDRNQATTDALGR